MSMNKFFVYAHGRWCEVEVADGSVSGWREKARFVFCRRGRVEVARPAAVLRGLRALQAGNPTTVRDGPRLSQRKCVTKEATVTSRRDRVRPHLTHTHAHAHAHCCTHARTCNCNLDITSKSLKNSIKPPIDMVEHVKVDASTQVQADVHVQTVRATLSLSPIKQPLASKRKRQDSSFDESFEVTKLKAGSKLRLTKIKNHKPKKGITDSTGRTTKVVRGKENKGNGSADVAFEITQPKKKVKLPPLRPWPAKRKRSESSSDAATNTETRNRSAKNTPTKHNQSTSKRRDSVSSSSDSDIVTKPITRNSTSKNSPSKKPVTSKRRDSVSSSSDSDVEITKPKTRNSILKNSPTKLNSANPKRRDSVSSSSDSDAEITKPKTRNSILKNSPTKLNSANSKRRDSVSSSSDSDAEITKPKTRNSILKNSPTKLNSANSKRRDSVSSSSDADFEITKPKTRNSTLKNSPTKLNPANSKRRDSVSSSSDVEVKNPKTRNPPLKNSPTKKPVTSKRRESVSSSSDSAVEMTKPETRNSALKNSPTKLKPVTSKRIVSVSSSSDSDVEITKPETRNSTSKNGPVKHKTIPTKLKSSEISRINTEKITETESRNRRAKNSKQRLSASFDSDSTVIITKLDSRNHLAVKQKSNTVKRGDLESVLLSELTKPIRTHRSSSNGTRDKPSAIQMSKWLANTNQKRDNMPQGDLCKELIIEESDVEVMRQFLMKYAMDIDIEAFDGDDEYKRMVFYRINPLVNVERCPMIAEMCRRESRPDVTLQDFVSNLGLRSITESPSQASSQYKTRSKLVNKHRDPSSDDTDKENFKAVEKDFKRQGVKNGRIHKKAGPRKILNKIRRTKDSREGNKTSNLNSDSERERDGAIVSKPSQEQETRNPSSVSEKIRHIISKQAVCPSREYSNLEDHTIVSWVSVGGRASRVNGNQVWRELQPLYPRLVGGGTRSWHSLRNRYLRYILPALPKLHLTHDHVARLRAAAATGSIKSKKRPPRRNSIFNKETGVSGAWSRRPRSPIPTHDADTLLDQTAPDTHKSDAEHSPPRRALRSSVRPSGSPGTLVPSVSPGPSEPPRRSRTPRYSELTRQFSARHPPPLASSTESASPPPAPLLRAHRKKLFNPKSVPV